MMKYDYTLIATLLVITALTRQPEWVLKFTITAYKCTKYIIIGATYWLYGSHSDVLWQGMFDDTVNTGEKLAIFFPFICLMKVANTCNNMVKDLTQEYRRRFK